MAFCLERGRRGVDDHKESTLWRGWRRQGKQEKDATRVFTHTSRKPKSFQKLKGRRLRPHEKRGRP